MIKTVPKGKVAVYRHLKPNGEVFYIGIGKGIRPYATKNRTKFWKGIVAKYGYEVQILTLCDDRESAKELEKILISYYGRRNLGTGTLVNLTDGGDGRIGMTQKEKDAIGDFHRGKKLSEEHRARLYEGSKKKCFTESQRIALIERNKNTIFSEDRRRKQSLNIKNNMSKVQEAALKANCKPVLQFTMEGEFIREWGSAAEARKTTGIDCTKNLTHKSKYAGKYVWKYKSEYEESK